MDRVWQWGVLTVVAILFTAGTVFFIGQNSFDLKMSVLQRQISDLQKEVVATNVSITSENKITADNKVEVENKGNGDCFSKYEITRIINNVDRSLSFNYPCGWNLRASGANFIVVSSPDGSATFTWPISDMGLHDMKLLEEGKVMVNGKEYPFSKYQGENSWLEIVEVVYDKNDSDFRGFVLSGKDARYEKELMQILASVKF